MNAPVSNGLIIATWPSIGKADIGQSLAELNELGDPTLLGHDWPNLATAEDALTFFQGHHAWAVCEAEGSLVGGFGLRKDQNSGWFYYFLLPSWRGHGHSRFILAAIELAAAEMGIHEQLCARCGRDNVASLKTLGHAGYVMAEESAPQAARPWLLLSKSLSARG